MYTTVCVVNTAMPYVDSKYTTLTNTTHYSELYTTNRNLYKAFFFVKYEKLSFCCRATPPHRSLTTSRCVLPSEPGWL